MSLVKIVHHDEVIYTILDKPPPPRPRTPIYMSKLEKELKVRKIPQLCLTMGRAKAAWKKPDQFLKRGEGMHQPIKKSDHVCYHTGKMLDVPKRPPPGKGPEKPQKNFLNINMRKAIKTKPKEIVERLIDSRDGHVKTIKGSGEVPEFCKRPDFGKMPEYLVKRNNYIFKKAEEARIAEENRPSLCKLISPEERDELLKNLKHNWALKQKAYLQLPMVIDTVPKINNKVKMEKDLLEIEKDIQLVEKSPLIYIYDDDKVQIVKQ